MARGYVWRSQAVVAEAFSVQDQIYTLSCATMVDRGRRCPTEGQVLEDLRGERSLGAVMEELCRATGAARGTPR